MRYPIKETDAGLVNVDKLTYAGNLNSLQSGGDPLRVTVYADERIGLISDADSVGKAAGY